MEDLIGIRTLAHRFLLEQGIHRLQLSVEDLIELCQKLGYKVKAYNEAEVIIEKLKLQESARKESFTYNKGDYKVVFYQGDLSYGKRVRNIAHEIGHIYLGHKPHCAIVGNSPDREEEQRMEDEANVFYSEFLAIPCVLRKMKIYSTAQIENFTFLINDDCVKIQHNLKFFMSLPDDEKILEQYNDFIKEHTPSAWDASTLRLLLLGCVSSFALGAILTFVAFILYYRSI